MTRFRLDLLSSTYTGPDVMYGALDDGYLVYQSNTVYNMVEMIGQASPNTVIGSASLGGTPYFQRAGFNCAGTVFVAYNVGSSSATWNVKQITQTGGTAVNVTTIATGVSTPPTATTYGRVVVTPDGAQVGLDYIDGGGTATTRVINVAGGTVAYTLTGTGHYGGVIAMPAQNRHLRMCSTHGSVELSDETGTILSTMSLTQLGGSVTLTSGGVICPSTNRALFSGDVFYTSNPLDIFHGYMSTTGDTLSWVWGPSIVTTDWVASFKKGAATAAWGNAAVTVPGDSIGTVAPFGPVGHLRVSLDTGTVTLGAADAGANGGCQFWGGGGYMFGFGGQGYLWKVGLSYYGNHNGLWSVILQSATTYLRQRQSEVRAPSRVRGVDLRQRQTNRVTG